MKTTLALCLLLALPVLAQFGLRSPQLVSGLNRHAASGGGTAPDNTMLVHLPMNEGSGTVATNYGTHTSHLAITGATWVTGQNGSGHALQFDGVNDYAKMFNVPYGTNAISISLWLYWDSFANDDDLAFEMSQDSNGTWPAVVFGPNSSGAAACEVSVRDSGGYRQERFTRPSAAVWHHYVIICDRRTASADFIVYLDGAEVSTTTGMTAANATSNFVTAYLNLMSRNGTSLFADGRMDDFRIFTGVLDPDEVTYLYNNPE